MTNATADVDRDQVPFTSLVPFLLIAFGLARGIFVLFVLFTEEIVEISGELTGGHPLFFLAVYAPAIASFIIVAYYGGVGGWRRYPARLLLRLYHLHCQGYSLTG